MNRLHLLTALLVSFFSFTTIAFAQDNYVPPGYLDHVYPASLTPTAAPATQKTQPQRQAPIADSGQHISAPDEDARLEPTPKSATQTVREERLDGAAPAVGPSPSGSLIRVRTTSHITFTGNVTAVDTVGKTISVKSTGKNLTFDLTNPVLRGYPKVTDIKTGDTITLGYIRNGIGIVKGENFHEDLREQTAADELVPLKSKNKRSKRETAKQQSNRATPVRVKYKVNTLAFKDVDNNKDGKISPVELCTVVPSLTMEDFKRYDRNGDGCLSESEYRTVRK